MSQPYVGEIRMFAGNFAPSGWAFCDGSLLAISDYDTLFNLIGTTYGGDGQSTFALPVLRGRVPIHIGNSYTLAQTGGAETVTLTAQQIPAHSHSLQASNAAATSTTPTNNVLASPAAGSIYRPPASPVPMKPTALAGGSQPHENRMPFLSLNFILSLYGIYPSPT